jgi:hypothetical protein
MNRFRPVDMGPLFYWREYKKLGYRTDIDYNWQPREEWWPAGYKFNHRVIGRQFKVLHYRAHHAPKPIRQKWIKIARDFEARHFATRGKASVRYINTYTAAKWL